MHLATQKKMISWPVSRREPGKKAARSSVLLGQPSTEKGKRPEENQVSRTSGSCSSSTSASGTLNLAAALLFASASLRPETQYASSVESAFAFPLMVTW